MKTRENLLNNDTNEVMRELETSINVSRGIIILCIISIFGLSGIAKHYHSLSKASQSKIDSLKSSNKSLQDNLLMPVEIEKFNSK